jgi:flagellar hook protein FlgE
MYTGVSGLLANANAINVIGNNLANTNTVGFKEGRTLFSTLLSTNFGSNSQIGNGMQVQAVQNLFTAGSYQNSTNVTDVAIQGNGFFALAPPTAVAGTAVSAGTAYYTRAGAFSLDSTGLGLVNPDGYKVLDTAGKPIDFQATYTPAGGTAQNFQKVSGIDANGNISLLYADASGNTSTAYYAGAGAAPLPPTPTGAVPAGAVQIAEVTVPNPQGMLAQTGTLFKLTAASGTPTLPAGAPAGSVFASANGASEKLLSNELEASNVDMATELVNLITTQRAYSANSKTITTADQMTQEVLSLKQ